MKSLGGIAPYGYSWREGKLVIDDREAPIRKLIYELFLKHRRKRTVAKLLNDLGYRTRSSSLFSDTTIDRLLRDTAAKGTRVVGGQIVEVEPIISIEMWERVNRILGGDRPLKQPTHIFSGKAYCGCGGRMIIHHDSRKYVCVDCRQKILADDLESIFHSQLNITAEHNSSSLYEAWPYLTDKEKTIVTEQLCERIVVERDTIRIEFSFQLDSDQTADVALQSEISNENGHQVKVGLMTEPLLSEAEAAEFLGISKMTLLRRRTAAEIRYFKVGHRVLYSKEKHLIPFLEQCEQANNQHTS